ncbi:hypothetical protein M9H77_21702 [Catharanthus roseus]|uniref:Uncharacterized protein n=1 Tax=Catharanthus roseus TaxID=4058 RepID=A0ACC0ANF7_CATRO|nr:hypothetical protein M9H77_21702 [Catharanthus roseus]
MAFSSSPYSVLLLSLFSFFHLPVFSSANLHRPPSLFRSELLYGQDSDPTPPTTYFEVTKPIKLPKTDPCSYTILQHDFGYTYGKPPVLAHYTPPSNCPSQDFDKIVFEWKATCNGRQFDRIFGVWLGGVEIFRSCTAEPRATGTIWTVEKDITRYYSLLMNNHTLAVYLGNIVDKTYTGIYHVNISLHFYPAEEKYSFSHPNLGNSVIGFDSGADLILPISRNLPLNDGLWFEIENSTDLESKEFKIPQNAYRAVLEVYVSFHENDESWYANVPNEYNVVNNISLPGNGPLREVVVRLDDILVGAVWPFTVVYTGGVNPLLWRPITGIGSFDLPSYDIEITPFLGKILDGKTHKFGFSVTNALNVWYIDANLHLWLDQKSEKTRGKLLKYNISPLKISSVSNFTGFDGSFSTTVTGSIESNGWVKSSHGTIITRVIQRFNYSNFMIMGNKGNKQIVNQTIDFDDKVYVKLPSSSIYSIKSFKSFPLYLHTENVDQENDSYTSIENISFGFIAKKVRASDLGLSISSLKNLQKGQGYMVVKGNLVMSGLGSTQQIYNYHDDELCYFRNISSSNYAIVYDKISSICKERPRFHFGFGLGRGNDELCFWKSREASLFNVRYKQPQMTVAMDSPGKRKGKGVMELLLRPHEIIIQSSFEYVNVDSPNILQVYWDKSALMEIYVSGGKKGTPTKATETILKELKRPKRGNNKKSTSQPEP